MNAVGEVAPNDAPYGDRGDDGTGMENEVVLLTHPCR